MKRNNKGFTLAEMLIVVAIIAILVGIVSSTIVNALEKAREAVDMANIRNAMSEVAQAAIMEDTSVASGISFKSDDNGSYYNKVVYITQKLWGWQSNGGIKQITINGAVVQAKQGNDSDKKLNTGWYIKYYISGKYEGTIRVNTKK